ncbi:hypothetical protein L2E82_30141 [Cichorium intybus]|uniref:Uncharacterized protein n=1 Tax=Cichorium intybus TaxID=13427 RepID=A0ACB9CZW1_CICIN|nr:hypothetical protein L2E82_30141 [Cichorium intybus]
MSIGAMSDISSGVSIVLVLLVVGAAVFDDFALYSLCISCLVCLSFGESAPVPTSFTPDFKSHSFPTVISAAIQVFLLIILVGIFWIGWRLVLFCLLTILPLFHMVSSGSATVCFAVFLAGRYAPFISSSLAL